MSRASREAQRRIEVKKRNRVIATVAAGLLAVGSALVLPRVVGGDSSSDEMPAAIESLIKGSAIKPEYSHKLSKEKYREIASRQINGRNIRYSEIGEPRKVDPEIIFRAYERISKFIDKNPPTFKVNLTKYDGANQLRLGDQQVEVALKANKEDVHVFGVGYNVTGEKITDELDVFTEGNSRPRITILKPDAGRPELQSLIEACQGLITAEYVDESFMGDGLNKDRVRNVVQEQVCNSLGTAVALRLGGFSYENYFEFMQHQVHNVTSTLIEPAPIGFAGRIPYVSTAEAYSAISDTIPTDFFQNLIYPTVL